MDTNAAAPTTLRVSDGAEQRSEGSERFGNPGTKGYAV